jgi:hypothetical protein
MSVESNVIIAAIVVILAWSLQSYIESVQLTIAALFTILSLYKVTSTSSIAGSNEAEDISVSKFRLIALHSFNLAFRWGFSLLILAYSVLPLNQSKFKNILTIPIEVQFYNLDILQNKNQEFFVAVLFVDLIVLYFNHCLSSDLWKAIIASSAVPTPKPGSLHAF